VLEYGDNESQFETLSLSDIPVIEKFCEVLLIQWNDTASMERHGIFPHLRMEGSGLQPGSIEQVAGPYGRGKRSFIDFMWGNVYFSLDRFSQLLNIPGFECFYQNHLLQKGIPLNKLRDAFL